MPRPRIRATSRLPPSPASKPQYSRPVERRGVCRLHADAGPAHSGARHAVHREGRSLRTKMGCVHCHTPSFTTGKMIASGSSTSPSAALSNQTANLSSDLLVHHMGRELRRHHTRCAGPDEFRTAPLWGVGQRSFSSMTDERAIWWRLSKITRAGTARPTRSSTISISCTLRSSKTSSTSCGRSSSSGAGVRLGD